MSKIFVCVPTMNDFEYLSTIERAYDYASDPDNISIATTIFWKDPDFDEDNQPFFTNLKMSLDNNFKKVKYDIQPWHLFPGVGNGRISPTKHFNNEKYFLSIDSHTDFIQDWDSILIDLYEDSRKFFGKRRLLTTYLTPYKNNNKDDGYSDQKTLRFKKDEASRWQFFDFYKNLGSGGLNSKIFPLPNDKNVDKETIKLLEPHMINSQYLPAKKISAHFYFVEADPWLTKYNLNLHKDITFWGEEFYQSSLSYARGYNLVWIKKQVLFHQYEVDRSSRAYEDTDKNKFKSFQEKLHLYDKYIKNSIHYDINKINIDSSDDYITKTLIDGKMKDIGYTPRSIDGFLKYSGIDLVNRKTSPWWEVPEINVVYK